MEVERAELCRSIERRNPASGAQGSARVGDAVAKARRRAAAPGRAAEEADGGAGAHGEARGETWTRRGRGSGNAGLADPLLTQMGPEASQETEDEPPRVREPGRRFRADDLRLGNGAGEAAPRRAGILAPDPVHGEARVKGNDQGRVGRTSRKSREARNSRQAGPQGEAWACRGSSSWASRGGAQ